MAVRGVLLSRASDDHRRSAVDALLNAERAARVAGEEAGRWWRDLSERAGRAITTPALDSLFRDALATMREALGSDSVSVLIANEAGDALVTRVSVGLEEEVSPDLSIGAGEGLAGRVLSTAEPRIVPDLSKIELASPLLHITGVRSLVAVPIVAGGRPLGVLHAASFALDHFGAEDQALLELFAQHLASAMDRVRLFEAERAARSRAEVANTRLERLYDAATRLSAATTPDDVAAILVDVMAEESAAPAEVWSACWQRQDGGEALVGMAGPVPAECSGGPPALVPDGFEIVTVGIEGGGVASGTLAVCWATTRPGDENEQAVARTACREGAQAVLRLRLQLEEREQARTSRFLGQAARVLAEASNLQETLERLAQVALPVLGDICLIDLLGEEGTVERMVALHRDPARQPLVDPLRHRYPPVGGGLHPAAQAIRTGRGTWSPSMDDDFLHALARDDEHYLLIKRLDYRSYITVPLLDQDDAMGAVTFISTSEPFDAEDGAFAERLAEQVTAVVANARRFESTQHTARVLQESLLPHLPPAIGGVTFEGRYLAATRGLEVGGDFYDAFPLPSGSVGFVIGDVEGHDREAATMMGRLRSAARACFAHSETPAALVDALRQSWGLLEIERIVTALFGTVDPATGMVRLASAGHLPPLLLPAEGAPSFVTVPSSPPLGVRWSSSAERCERLPSGSVLLLYTDGAVESRARSIDEGMGSLAETAARGGRTAPEVCDRVVELLGTERADDVALLVLGLGETAA